MNPIIIVITPEALTVLAIAAILTAVIQFYLRRRARKARWTRVIY